MLYRVLASLIVIFWITMTALLVRKEVGPGDSSLREVPVGHVVKLLFLHAQSSDLEIYSEKLRVGHLQVHPHVRAEDSGRLVNFNGQLQVALPGQARQRMAWTGELEMDKVLAMQRAKLTVTFRDPAISLVEVVIDPRARQLRYESRVGDRLLDQGQYSLDEQGALTWLREQGLDPALLASVGRPPAVAPVVKALQSSIEYHGQKIDTYLVTAEQGGQTLLEFHVSQLGKILRVKTFVGYWAAPDDLLP
ncbi:MAG: hypothetical protein QOE70_3980 [Chthoniobacter sp.]|jgi:hypothetical protein|nr:hypothetical protein [Chthoniobacter sp.]